MEKVGAYPQIAATRKEVDLNNNVQLFTEHTQSEYMQIGKSFKSPLFDFTMKNFMVKRNEYCYAGAWGGSLNLATGIFKPCYVSPIEQNIFENIENPISYCAVGKHCKSPFCMNSSHFISLGVIPTYMAPSYVELRNRNCKDGSMWYNKRMLDFLSQKLYDNHTLYNKREKIFADLLYYKCVIKNFIHNAIQHLQ